MAVPAETNLTFDLRTMREQLREAFTMVSPEETPIISAIGRGAGARNTYVEWPTVQLPAAAANRHPQGDLNITHDNSVNPRRFGAHTQIALKSISVSTTANAVDAAGGNLQNLARQLSLQLAAMRTDQELMFWENVVSSPGSRGVSGSAPGVVNSLYTNTDFGVGGSAAGWTGGEDTLGPISGYPNAVATAGTPRPLTEVMFLDMHETCWNSGANPKYVFTNGNYKRKISQNFTGIATPYKNANERAVMAAVDVYEGDYGTLLIVPDRFAQDLDVGSSTLLFLDPMFAELSFLQDLTPRPLAVTGLADEELVYCEYTHCVLNEKAHGMITDLDGTVA